MTKGMRIIYSLIVVDYHTAQRTLVYIESIQNHILSDAPFHAIFIDNTEDESGLCTVRQKYGTGILIECKNVKFQVYKFCVNNGILLYCASGENLGYAKGNNLGTQIADYLFNDPYYLISNNDIVVNKNIDFNQVITLFEQDSHIAVVGPRVLKKDGQEQSPHKKITAFKHLLRYYWDSALNIHSHQDIDYTGESKRCYWVSGCFMFVHARALQEVNGFDPNTFLFAEEMILSERLAQKGYYYFFSNKISVLHCHGETIKKMASVLNSLTWSFDSCCYFYQTYRNVSDAFIQIAKINFACYKKVYMLKQKIKKLIKSNK